MLTPMETFLVPLGMGKGHQSPGELRHLNTRLPVHSVTQLKNLWPWVTQCCCLLLKEALPRHNKDKRLLNTGSS